MVYKYYFNATTSVFQLFSLFVFLLYFKIILPPKDYIASNYILSPQKDPYYPRPYTVEHSDHELWAIFRDQYLRQSNISSNIEVKEKGWPRILSLWFLSK